MKTTRKGTRAELKTIRWLEAADYLCMKTGGSLGLFDVVALGPADVRFIQVKARTARLSRAEREGMTALVVPEGVSVEYWKWNDYARESVIDVVLCEGTAHVSPDSRGSRPSHTKCLTRFSLKRSFGRQGDAMRHDRRQDDPERRPAEDNGTVLDMDGHIEVSFLLPDRQEAITAFLRGDLWTASLDDFG